MSEIITGSYYDKDKCDSIYGYKVYHVFDDEHKVVRWVYPFEYRMVSENTLPIKNIERIKKAKRAVELGLNIEIPEPEFEYTVLSKEEWKKMLANLKEAWNNGKVIKIKGDYYLEMDIEPGSFMYGSKVIKIETRKWFDGISYNMKYRDYKLGGFSHSDTITIMEQIQEKEKNIIETARNKEIAELKEYFGLK